MCARVCSSGLLAILLLLGATLACGGLGDDGWRPVELSGDGDAARDGAQRAARVLEPAELRATAMAGAPVEDAAATATKRPPTPIPAPQLEALRVLEQGFGQNGSAVGYAFVVENGNAVAVEGAQYRVMAYGADGGIMGTDTGYAPPAPPGETLSIASTMYVDEGVLVDAIKVSVSGGRQATDEATAGFEASQVRFFGDEASASVTAVVKSGFAREIKDVRVSAVLYDAQGAIVGAGFSFINFVPAEGATGVQIYVQGPREAARVEVHAALSSLSLLAEGQQAADGARAALLQSGFGQDGRRVGYGMVVENNSGSEALEGLMYRVTAYGVEGQVLGVDEGYAPMLLAAQAPGIGGALYLAVDEPVARLDAQIGRGRFVAQESDAPHFDTEEAAFQDGSFSSSISGFVVNGTAWEVTDLRVSALVFDEAGAIRGGGYTFLNVAQAGGRTAVTVPVVSDGAPARATLYAAASVISERQ